MKRLIIGGAALVKLGSSRQTEDLVYLINDESTDDNFIHDQEKNIDYINANGHVFFREIWEMEKNNIGEIASPRALLELKAFAFVQHCLNGFWQKADDEEFDIRFLARKYNIKETKIVQKYIDKGQQTEIEKVLDSVRR
jgi:hypothetical protein